ncbi:MAG: thioredoxin family protein [Candidatus Margulisiibacteriota bacterium]|nr:MAG: redox-active disulfide protein 2 [Candidatus Margulisbacteria bacterium GWD2_39_127]OGI02356.1 MAG: redox-active disulfide protein 2 [Candidatus Margulisbacteria bacterium GWF2_38_17]OGI08489.1 MAG: redox-active disulfide protein 2 [Candidatus Margulisbacteria bacterium GWE2_39_32]PZM79001.1 MAG: thioredoxin family protein [Candidatus Margulisiibacteriota bacterium]HAR64221.1 thioredoxin family protein [Candidatus Margulisiibacteriota bacterium]
MKKIEILGMGCAKCSKLAEVTEAAAKALGEEYIMEKVTDIKKIMEYGVMVTPALVVNGKVRVAGKVPGIDELKELLI